MPVEAAIVLDRLQAEGRLHILKGRLKHINFDARFDIKYTTGEIENTLAADSIINCIGSESNFERLDAPLVINLFNAATSATMPSIWALTACKRCRVGKMVKPPE